MSSTTQDFSSPALNGQQLTTTLIENIRQAAIQTAIEAVLLACRIEEWHTGQASNEALLKELERTQGNDIWVAMAQRGNFSPTYAYRFLEAAARERMNGGAA